MRLLLDTHVVIWWLVDDPTLSGEAKRLLDQEPDVFLSAATVWEIAIKQQFGKLVEPQGLAEIVRGAGFRELPMTSEHAIAAARLPPVHRDPFDRMLVAQARLEDLTLVTRDLAIQKYEVAILAAQAHDSPTEITAHYDVPLPDQLFYFERPLPLPYAVRTEADFEVAGKDVDTFTVAIGAPSTNEGSWPTMYAVDVTLVERSGARIAAGQAVLMDQESAGDADGVVQRATSGGLLLPDCVQHNVQLLDEVAKAPGKHSPEIAKWRKRLPEALAILAGRSSPIPSAAPLPPGEDAAGTWIVQLQSLPHDRVSAGDVERARAETERRLGVPVKTLNSTDFASLNPGYWVLYHAGNFRDGHQAAAVCSAHGMGVNADCFGRYLSHDATDRNLICFVAPARRQSRCERSQDALGRLAHGLRLLATQFTR